MNLFLLGILSLETVQRWFQTGGYFILFGLLFACGLGFPLPEDVPLMFGGYFVALNQMDIVLVSIFAWTGIIGGDCMLYWLSRRYGMNITKVRMIGSHVTKERILWAEEKFEKYGIWVVAICRMVAGIRGAMVIAAGVLRYNFLKFIIADGLAAIVSGGFFVYLGWLAGTYLGSVSEMREKIKSYEHYVILGFLLVVALIVFYIVWRKRKHTTLTEVAVKKVEHIAEKVAHRHEGQQGDSVNPSVKPDHSSGN